MLDVLDKELEKRGHCFVRYADADSGPSRTVIPALLLAVKNHT